MILRRKEREMDERFALEIIDKSNYGVLSMMGKNNEAHGIPLSIVRDGNLLYFHSAKSGEKVEIFLHNPKVSATFVGETRIPDIFTPEELAEIIKDESKTKLLISRVFTTECESALVKGRIELVSDENEKFQALKLICEKYTPTKMDYFPLAIKSGLKATNVYKIEMEEVTAKRIKYDSNGEEMKWGRMLI